MMNNIEKLEELKEQIIDKKTKIDRAIGGRDEAMRNLETKFKITSIKEAKQLQNKLKKEAAIAEEAFNEAESNFRKKWGESL